MKKYFPFDRFGIGFQFSYLYEFKKHKINTAESVCEFHRDLLLSIGLCSSFEVGDGFIFCKCYLPQNLGKIITGESLRKIYISKTKCAFLFLGQEESCN
jgi:hypothetical protein